MKIVVTGKNGLLTTMLRKIDSSLIFLPKEEYDITDSSVIDKLHELNPDIVIHAGAITSIPVTDIEKESIIKTNIIGSANVSLYCIQYHKRLIYISTDYVYDGRNIELHKESDAVLPYNDYAWTKLAGECSTRLVPNHVIIRTSFGNSVFPHAKAYGNLIVSKDYIDIIAPKILKVIRSNFIGVINIGTEPKTVFEYASRRNSPELAYLPQPKNFSLNLELYEQIKEDI